MATEWLATQFGFVGNSGESEFEDIDLGDLDVMKFSRDLAQTWLNVPQVADSWILQTADINGDGLDDILFRIPLLNASKTAVLRSECGIGSPKAAASAPCVKPHYLIPKQGPRLRICVLWISTPMVKLILFRLLTQIRSLAKTVPTTRLLSQDLSSSRLPFFPESFQGWERKPVCPFPGNAYC